MCVEREREVCVRACVYECECVYACKCVCVCVWEATSLVCKFEILKGSAGKKLNYCHKILYGRGLGFIGYQMLILKPHY